MAQAREWLRTTAPALCLIALQLVAFPIPLGAWIRGLIIGLLVALLAVGLALIYRANRVINFSQADLGFAPCSFVVGLVVFWTWPWFVGFGIGVIAAAVVGAAVEFFLVRRFRSASRLVLTVATIGIAQLLAVVSVLVPRWWGRSAASQRLPAPFELQWEIGSFVLSSNDLVALVLAPVALVGVALFLNRTRTGTAVRAAAERSERAALLGIGIGRLSTLVWSIAAVLSFLAIYLRAGILGVPLGSALSITTLVSALAALVIGRLFHLMTIATTAVSLGVLEYGIIWNQDTPLLTAPIIAGVILVALLAQRRDQTRSANDTTSSWSNVGRVAALPAAIARRRSVRVVRAGLWVLAVIGLLVVPVVLRVDQLIKVNAIVIFAVIAMSLVVLTGWAGQISLGQMAFVAIGAAVSGWLTSTWTIDITLAIVGGAVAGSVAALVVGLPALRLQGLYLAVTTLAFALAVSSWLLNRRFFAWVPEDRLLRYPVFGRLDISTPTRYYVFTLIVAALIVIAIRGIRHSRTGRVILALRDNDQAAQSFSIAPIWGRLRAFMISGAVAGAAGGLFAHLSQAFDPATYGVGSSIEIFTATVVGGLGSLGGAVLGASFLRGTQWFIPSAEWRLLFSAFGVLLALLILPGGLISGVTALRDLLVRRLIDTEQMTSPTAETPGDVDGEARRRA